MNWEFVITDLAASSIRRPQLAEAIETRSMSLAVTFEPAEQSDFSPDNRKTETHSRDGLAAFVGLCAVVDLSEGETDGLEIGLAETTKAVESVADAAKWLRETYGGNTEAPRRILFKTRTAAEESRGRFFTDEAITFLIESDVILFGTDTLTLEADEQSHHRIARLIEARFPCLLNLDLQGVDAGILYRIVAAPVIVSPAGLNPVRPILLTIA